MAHFKVYKLRHQVAGVLHAKQYAKPPSAEEIAKVAEAMRKKHVGHVACKDGTHHKKTGQPLFLKVVEEIVESDDPMPGYEEVAPPADPSAELVTLKGADGKPFAISTGALREQLEAHAKRARGDMGEADAPKIAIGGAGTVTNPA